MYVNEPSLPKEFSVPCAGSLILVAVNGSLSASVSLPSTPGAATFRPCRGVVWCWRCHRRMVAADKRLDLSHAQRSVVNPHIIQCALEEPAALPPLVLCAPRLSGSSLATMAMLVSRRGFPAAVDLADRIVAPSYVTAAWSRYHRSDTSSSSSTGRCHLKSPG